MKVIREIVPRLSISIRTLMKCNLVKGFLARAFGQDTILRRLFFNRFFLLGLFTVLFISIVTVYALAMNSITVSVDGQLVRLRTTASTVKAVIEKYGFALTKGDMVMPSLEAEITDGMEIKVARGVNVLIFVDGKEVSLRSASSTLNELLTKAGISLGPLDKTSIPLEEKVWEGLRVKVTRVATEQIFTKTAVKPTTIYINDRNLEIGRRRVLTNGEPGLIEKEYEVIYEDGKEVKRIFKGQKVLKKVVRKRVAVGTRPHVLVTRGHTIKYKKMRIMNASAYTPGPESCGIYADGYTATGKKAGHGIVAVDPRVIPLGTKLYIEGYGFAAAEDVGSAIKGNRIDLCYETVREALLFGRRRVKVYILAQ